MPHCTKIQNNYSTAIEPYILKENICPHGNEFIIECNIFIKINIYIYLGTYLFLLPKIRVDFHVRFESIDKFHLTHYSKQEIDTY